MFMGRGVNIDKECVEWLSMTLVCDGYCQVHNSSGFWGISKFHHSIHLSYLSSWLFHLLIHPWILFPPTFHVSELHFVSCFCFTSHLCPLVLFLFPKPKPWHIPNSHYPDMFLFNTYMFRTSCMFLSLKLTLIVPRTPRLNLWMFNCPLPKTWGQ